jgi:hypothetical protein
VVDFEGEADQDESSWACEMKGQDGAGFLKIKNTPPGWEEKLKNRSGEFTLLADSLLDGDELVLPENANVNAILAPRGAGNNNGNGRRLARVVGDKSVLVVRVIAQDFSTSSSVSDLSDNVFGTNGDPVNLKSQYEDCSYNKLRFNPTQDPRTTNGVYEVTISSFISRGNRRASKEMLWMPSPVGSRPSLGIFRASLTMSCIASRRKHPVRGLLTLTSTVGSAYTTTTGATTSALKFMR